jgi:hypothetical protein
VTFLKVVDDHKVAVALAAVSLETDREALRGQALLKGPDQPILA